MPKSTSHVAQDGPLLATHVVVPVVKTTSEPQGVVNERDGSSSNDTASLGDAQEGASAMPTSHKRGKAVGESTLLSTTDNDTIHKTEAPEEKPAVHEVSSCPHVLHLCLLWQRIMSLNVHKSYLAWCKQGPHQPHLVHCR